jgi:hypothetical protein
MTDADLELRLRQWLAADAAAMHAPDALQRRVLDIPASTSARGAWWHRFAGMPAYAATLATAGVAGVLIATMFFGLFDRPAGTDGGTCSNRQVQQALDNLRDAEGYRYINHDRTRQLDPDAGLSFEDPQYVWTDAWTSEGAYLAPDKAVDRPTFTRDDGLYDRGYLEHLQIAGHTYRLSEIDGVATWVEETNWPTANLAYGYLGAAFPSFSVPLVSGADWGGTAVTPELPGTGGCTAATPIPLREDEVGFVPQRAVTLRVDVRTLLPTAIAIGPAVGERAKEGDSFSTWLLTWETPDAAEFVAPTDAAPDPNTVEQSFVPTPTAAPPEPDPGAWPAEELPATEGASVSDVVAGEDRIVAVGSTFPDGSPSAAIWVSTDGASWELLDGLPDGDGLAFSSIEWNGETYLALGYRDFVPPEGPQFTSARPETWLSEDGMHWEIGGEIGPARDSGEVANPGRPVFTGQRWVAGGAIYILETNQQRPAFFVSRDGTDWQTVELDDVGSGSLGTVVVMPDGSLLATGCEAPGGTNSGPFGESCYTRPWRSDDGLEWTAGEISDLHVGTMTRWGDRLIGIVSASDPTGQNQPTSRLATSLDGIAWEDVDGFSAGSWNPYFVEVPDGELVVLAQYMAGDAILAGAWRSEDGTSWETVPLGFPAGTGGIQLGGAAQTPSGLAILGGVSPFAGGDSVPILWHEPTAD